MNYERASNLNTFFSVTGSINKRIQSSTGLPDVKTLTDRMHERSTTTLMDLLISNICNQRCPECFFNEQEGNGLKRIGQDDMGKIRNIIQDFQHLSPDEITIYPREITTDLGLLDIFSEQGITKVLTNGKLLDRSWVLDAFRRAGIKEMMVTVPGNEDSYALYTGERTDTYERLLHNIKTAVTSGFRVDVFYPVMATNIADIDMTIQRLSGIGVSSVNFNRVIPTGRATHLPDEYFLASESALELLYRINDARRRFDRRQIDISLYGIKLGPNFYNKTTFKILAEQTSVWPHHLYEYLCPMVGNQYIGVSYETNNVYPCFQALSFSELQIGTYHNGKITRTRPVLSAQELSEKLRGQCAKDVCEYQSLCMGGCRMTAFAFAKRRGEEEPLFAGQDICMTRLFDQITK